MFKSKFFLAISFLLSFQGVFAQLQTGFWRFVLKNDGGGIPFNMEIVEKNKEYKAYLLNAEERLELETIVFSEKKDSIFIPLHVFDACLALKLEGKKMRGVYRKHYNKTDQELEGTWGERYRFLKETSRLNNNFTGKWQTTFTNAEGRSYPAIGVFKQDAATGKVTGSFLTTTGDYRYLEGNVYNNQIYLSTFDGGFAYRFYGTLEKDTLRGEFWSGKNKAGTFKAVLNEKATLPDASQLTYLKEGYKEIDFKFPNLEGQMVSLKDERYKGKVVILQIFGSWCPNCIDETKFLAEWYRKNKKKPVAIIGLAYERKPEFEYAKQMVSKVVKRFNVEYDFLIAGTNDKEAASKTLPMLNGISSYPTTIFIDKKGQVRKIHTGFAGPGTGEYYQQWREEFNALMNTLLKE
jgi:thiol-disulfide isomerase/thioredoxin